MMRKNKFVLPMGDITFQPPTQCSPTQNSSINKPFQNKIYFPISQFEKLKPYQYELSNRKNKKLTDRMHSSQLLQSKQKYQIKSKNQKKLSFKRQKKFEKLQVQRTIDCSKYKSKKLEKYSTLELKNLPGISFTSSGKTIYRSKNIKSIGKFILEQSPRKIRRSQIKRNLSMKNQQIQKSGFPRSKSNRQSVLNSKQKKIALYQTYLSSRQQINSKINSLRPFQCQDFCQKDAEQFEENAEDLFCRSLIQAELYGSLRKNDQQQFF